MYVKLFIAAIILNFAIENVLGQITNTTIKNEVEREAKLKYKLQQPWHIFSLGSISFVPTNLFYPKSFNDLTGQTLIDATLFEYSISLFNRKVGLGSTLFERKGIYQELTNTETRVYEGYGRNIFLPLIVRIPFYKNLDKGWFNGISLKNELSTYEILRNDSVRKEYYLPAYTISLELHYTPFITELGYTKSTNFFSHDFPSDFFFFKFGIGLLGNKLRPNKSERSKDKAQMMVNHKIQNYVDREYNKRKFIRGQYPPKLTAEYTFMDENSNNILEAMESFLLSITLTNEGNSTACGIWVEFIDDKPDKCLKIEGNRNIRTLKPGDTKMLFFKINAWLDIKTQLHELQMVVHEFFGFDMDTVKFRLQTYEYREPVLVYTGYKVLDHDIDGILPIRQDGQLQLSERAKIELFVQNQGQGSAKDTQYHINKNDGNIFLESDSSGFLGTINPGETKNIIFTVTPNNRVDINKNVGLYLTLNDSIGRGNINKFQLPIRINEEPKSPEIIDIHPDIGSLMKSMIDTPESDRIKVKDLVDIKNVEYSKSHRKNAVAIVIGIENYDNLPSSLYAKNDADLMAMYFTKCLGVETVKEYTNKDVSGMFFDETFNPNYGKLLNYIKPNESEVYIYYSGHGIPDKKRENIYLIPSDGRKERMEAEGMSLATLYDNLDKMNPRSVTVILDACFSGQTRSSNLYHSINLTNERSVGEKVDSPWMNNLKFTTMNSSAYEETSLGYDYSQTGLFTYYLCAGLKGEADINKDKKLTLDELEQYVTKNVIKTSQQIFGVQTPVFQGNKDEVIVKY